MYPFEWWRDVLKVDLPENPSEEEVTSAYSTIVDFPKIHGDIADAYAAIQTIKNMPFSEEQELLLKRYGKRIEKLFELSRELNDIMDSDLMRAEQHDEEEESE